MEGQLPFWLALALIGVLLVEPVMGMPPLARVQAENLAAAEILIGQVESVTVAPAAIRQLQPDQEGLRLFTLGISHVVKSRAGAQVGDRAEVLFRLEEGQATQMGPASIHVSPGDMVIVYANPKEQKGHLVLLPVWSGFSVVRLAPPPKPGEAVRFPGPEK
jgi:hypothetical protein